MKLRIETDGSFEDEITIRAKSLTPEISRIKNAIEEILERGSSVSVRSGESEAFVPAESILFAEVSGAKTYVHTDSDVFVCPLRLYELEGILPHTFVKASKSCLINVLKIKKLRRSPSGVGEAEFYDSGKKAYVSRMYYKIVRDKTKEMRSIK